MRGLLNLLFLFPLLAAQAQTVCVRGHILDSETANPLQNYTLTVNGQTANVGQAGSFSLAAQAANVYRFEARCDGYRPLFHTLNTLSDTGVYLFAKSLTFGLSEVVITTEKDNTFGVSRLNNIEGTAIYAGKKSEAVYVQDLNANLAANNSRQVFSKIPGINIFENDGAGMQVGVGGRGLNPNRISNFNTRQNGYDISADALGYPESYYTPPTEAVDRIEILRGAASLQYGTQFGGMINYKFTEAPRDKKLSGNFRQTAGAFGFLNSFNQLSGTVKKLSYSTFYHYKQYTGWRAFSRLGSHCAFASLNYQVNEKLKLSGEYTLLDYLSRQPGGLTDKQFAQDESTVSRNRNWFKVNWNLFSLTADYKVNDHTRLNVMVFALRAGRDALGYLGRADRAEDTSANRSLLSDKYANTGTEIRLLRRYNLAGRNSHFLIGTRYYRGQTIRKQGDASPYSDADFRFLNPDNPENSSYIFPSSNWALFTENSFQLSKRWNITPGLRFEYISTASEGYYRLINKNLAGKPLLDKRISDNRGNTRSFLLAGLGTQYKFNGSAEVYANISQNYRSVNFNDMRVLNPNFEVDPQLKDESGYTADAGFRGALKNLLYYDIGVFLLQYNNRIGTTLKVDSATYQVVRFRTNIGRSRNTGLESFVELDWLKLFNKTARRKLSTFVNLSLIEARYISNEKAYDNKLVEYVPGAIVRTGVTYGVKVFSFTYQFSYTSRQYSDATNAATSPSGIYGLIPAYSVMDVSASYTYRLLGLYLGVNNLANNRYFTRRAEGYPGPGIIPADPLNWYLTLRLKF